MKKFFASLIGIVIFFLLVPTCTIFIIRGILSEKTIEVIMDTVPEILEVENEDGTTDNIIESFISDIEQEEPALAKQFKEEDIKHEIVVIITSMIENLGDPESESLLDTTSLKDYMDKVITAYEKEKGIELEDELKDELYESIDSELQYPREQAKEELGPLVQILEIVFSNNILITLVSLIVLCIIVIFALLQNIPDTLLKVKTPFLVNGIGTLIIGTIVYSILGSIELEPGVIPTALIIAITSPLFKVGIACIVLAVVLIVISKVLKNNRSIENSNNAIENLGNVNNYNPNNNISNIPYNGYQNH